MHLFDICVPSSSASVGDDPASNPQDHQSPKRDALYLEESDDTLYIDTLNTHDLPDLVVPMTTTQGARFHFDPSMYKFRDSLRSACIDSADTIQRLRSTDTHTINTIHLPAGRTLTYDNAQDVLHLRFTPPAFRFPDDGRHASPISAMFEGIWSEELASALHHAKRVALDVSQLWPDLADGQSDLLQDVAYLGCVLHVDLEVLYLVDYCAGRCHGAKVSGLMSRDGELYRRLYGYCAGGGGGARGDEWDQERRRKPDALYGVGKIWREIFDLEKLGWGERHPGLAFAETFSEVVRLQQANCVDIDGYEGRFNRDVKFKGIRVLIAEDEKVDGLDTSMMLSCGCDRQIGSQKDV